MAENKKQPSADPGDNNLPGIPNPLKGRKNFFWLFFLVMAVITLFFYFTGDKGAKEIGWKQFDQEMLAKGDVDKIVVVNRELAEIYIKEDALKEERHADVNKKSFGGSASSGPQYFMTIGSVETFENKLSEAQSEIDARDQVPVTYETRKNWMMDVFGWLLPLAIIVGFWIFMMRRLGSGGGAGNPMFNFGKSKAQVFDQENKSKINFDDIAGLEEAKVEVREVVEFLKNPEHYTRLGAKIPKGIMLIGPPGTGKTLLAKAVAGEAQVPFFSLSGSEFVEMFVGVGASRVRDLFDKAKAKAPSIIFIDEIDAIGRSRGKVASFQANDERESTLNQLLTEMDGFDPNTNVIVLAATNRADILDRALLRPGRFDRLIYLELPNLNERKAIFRVHMRPLKLEEAMSVDVIASQTPGFSGADIANVCNEAALIAGRKGKNSINRDDFNDAIDRVVGGLEKKSKIISPNEKKVIAYHEAGHAVSSWFLEYADALVKVSIVPRGRALGAAWYMPEEHQILTEEQFLDRMCMALGGRAAEDVIFGKISSGALDDLEKVTKQAYTMVAMYGFNKKLGNISYYDSSGQYEQSLQKPYSEATAEMIDVEVRKLVDFAYQRTRRILVEHESELHQIAAKLLEKEVIFKEDLLVVLGDRPGEKAVADS